MSASKPELYRWDRFTKPSSRVYSRSQRVTTDDDIQSWIKRVEVASENAAAEAFGLNTKVGKLSGKAAAQATLENVHDHDAAYEEAQELLSHWMTEKLNLDDGSLDNDDEIEETWLPRSKSQAAVKREWDHLVSKNEDEYGIGRHVSSTADYGGLSLYEADSDVIVGGILENLMKKDVVHGNVLNDLGLEPQQHTADPTTKMKLRHEQVKENRLKRQQDLEKKRREQMYKKEAEFQAKQIIKKEEKVKADMKRQEEEQIEQHMAVIRRERQAEQQRSAAQRQREKQEKEESKRRIHEEYERLVALEQNQKRDLQTAGDEKRRKIEQRLLEIEACNATENLKLKRRCFTGWYNILVERRLQMGRARALSEWKQMLRCWNAWRWHIRSLHLERETSQHQAELTNFFRKDKMAADHHRIRVLRKCMIAWQLYIVQCQQEKVIQQTQSVTRNKMAAFLEAASTGRLWKAGDDQDPAASAQSIQESIDATKNKLEELFAQQAKSKQGLDSARTDTSSKASSRVQSSRSHRGQSQPKAAWQLTKKDIKVKHKGQGDGDVYDDDNSSPVSGTSTQRRGSKPWERVPYVANNFEHRHQAQQKILEQQQKQLKEQQRLLEELQYLQRQQLLVQKISSQPVPENLQKHIENLQKEVEAAGITPPGGVLGQQQSPSAKPRDNSGVAPNDLKLVDLESGRDTSRLTHLDDVAMVTTERSDVTLPGDTNRTATSSVASGNSTTRPSSNVSKTSTNPKHVAFLKGMEDRASERSRMKAEREAKRRQAEIERLERLQAEEDERRQQEELEKQQRVEAHREKKRLDRQREIDRQKEIEEQQHQMRMAEEHHRLALLRYRGWYPWQCLVTMARNRRKQAAEHYTHSLLRKVLLSWHQSVRGEVEEKEALADEHCSYLLTRRCFTSWKRVGEILVIQEQKADRYFERSLKLKMLRCWVEYAEDEKIAMWEKARIAKEHNLVRIHKKYFGALRRYPQLRKEEEAREKRKEELRKKVASLLPDFEAPEPKVDTSVSHSFGLT